MQEDIKSHFCHLNPNQILHNDCCDLVLQTSILVLLNGTAYLSCIVPTSTSTSTSTSKWHGLATCLATNTDSSGSGCDHNVDF